MWNQWWILFVFRQELPVVGFMHLNYLFDQRPSVLTGNSKVCFPQTTRIAKPLHRVAVVRFLNCAVWSYYPARREVKLLSRGSGGWLFVGGRTPGLISSIRRRRHITMNLRQAPQRDFFRLRS